MLRIYNTATHKKEIFRPINQGKVHLYVCGPVIYKEIELGQVVSVSIFDIIRELCF